MSKRDNILLVQDMLESARKIQKFTMDLTYEEFIENEMLVDAVIRNFEVIGEAANRIETDFRQTFSLVEWKRIRGFRNRLVHDYFGIDFEIVWMIIEQYLDKLVSDLETILSVSLSDN